jgi:hypothetical protein
VQLDRARLLHRVDHDPDEQVEDQERRDEHVRDVEEELDVNEQQGDHREAGDAGDRSADRDREHAQVGQQPPARP